ncbi:MAG: ribonuclease H-like domain-containing protein [Clostridiales bacterium]|nr:ribonuclease H-like domain-containing protein [Clostridiales bacterium]
MASGLLRKLALLDDVPKTPTIHHDSGVSLFEKSFPMPEGINELSIDSLRLMGFSGSSFDLRRTIFLDTETTGLSGGAGTVAFLVGIGRVCDDRFVVKQYLMPDYSSEIEMLMAIKQDFASSETVVHFNGRRFDIPLLKNRLILKRIEDFTRDIIEFDLLYPTRAVWKLRLGSCRLGHIEKAILGLPERQDIPGSEIPQRYFESIKTQNTELLDDVIEHNRLDIYTLALLLVKLNECFSVPEQLDEQLDLFSLGRCFERHGELNAAEILYLKASQPRPIRTVGDLRNEKYRGEANLKLFLLARRMGDYSACEHNLLNMIKRRQLGSIPVLELCKLYEHRLSRLDEALELCNRLLEDSSDSERDELLKRRNRILAKIERKGMVY